MPHSVSFPRDDVGGALLLEAQFGVGVNVAAHGLDVGGRGEDRIDDVHVRSSGRYGRTNDFTPGPAYAGVAESDSM